MATSGPLGMSWTVTSMARRGAPRVPHVLRHCAPNVASSHARYYTMSGARGGSSLADGWSATPSRLEALGASYGTKSGKRALRGVRLPLDGAPTPLAKQPSPDRTMLRLPSCRGPRCAARGTAVRVVRVAVRVRELPRVAA